MSTTIAAASNADGELQRLLEERQKEVRRKLSLRRIWSRPDPELSKVLSQIHSSLSEISRLLVRRRKGDDWLYAKDIEDQLRAMLAGEDVTKLNINAAWEFSDSLRRMLLLLGDDSYIMAHLMNERAGSADENPSLKWERFLERHEQKDGADGRVSNGELPELLKLYKDGKVDDALRARTVEYLALVYSSRSKEGRLHRARIDMRGRYLTYLSLTLLVLLLLLSLTTFFASEANYSLRLQTPRGLWDLLPLNFLIQYLNNQYVRHLFIAAVAGAIGGVLSGFIKLRDQIKEMSDLRAHSAPMRAQPFVGATVGALFYLLLASGILGIGEMKASPDTVSWPLIAINCFLAGYSEPFFLRVVQRVGGTADKQAEAQASVRAGDERRREGEKRPAAVGV